MKMRMTTAANHNEQTIFYKLNEENYYENENIT